ncbi:hypothetical protein JTE90_013983 [Oedothorax gibbosus]|uniref:LIM zinc-binding domain-containing protein n=1 Tax=Oedothorax gibbosus TaxID=931172 RepID=A0AAV6UE88_9ARAC|nr:hypothetical protein JTE90_013983 [Oedothorax gibbosus]
MDMPHMVSNSPTQGVFSEDASPGTPPHGITLVPIRKKRNSNLATTESPYGNYPSDCCPTSHMSMMAAGHQGQSPHHPGDHPQHHPMMGMMQQQQHMGNMQQQQQQHQQQLQQQQQHFSPPGGGGGATRSCAGCGAKIVDRFLLHALDRYWHNGCLKCSCCQATLADIGGSCFTKGGMILCKSDYTRMFGGATCNGCGQMIMSSEYVMRSQSNIYHVKCFACVKCHNQLMTGDRYNLVNGSLLCEQDCIKMLKGTVTPATGVGGRKTKMRVNSAIKV